MGLSITQAKMKNALPIVRLLSATLLAAPGKGFCGLNRYVLLALSVAMAIELPSVAQQPPGSINRIQPQGRSRAAAATRATQPGVEGKVELNFNGPIRIDALLNYMSDRLGVQFEYSQAIGQRVVVLRTPLSVSVKSLPTLLSSVLRTESLAIVDSDLAGWKRVIDTADMARYTSQNDLRGSAEPRDLATPVTQVFALQNLAATSLASVLKPFLSGKGSNLTSIAETNVLIVTDFADRVQTVQRLLEIIDQPDGKSVYDVYQAMHQSSERLVEQAQRILGLGNEEAGLIDVSLFAEADSPRIVVAGTEPMVTNAIELLGRLDTGTDLETEVYRIKHTTAERMDKLVLGYLTPQQVSQAYRSTVDEDGNLLVVRGSQEVHQQIARLIAQIDVPVETKESPIQFYKLKNASAIDVLYTLLALQEAYGANAFSGAVVPAGFYAPLGGVTPMGAAGMLPGLGGFSQQAALGGGYPGAMAGTARPNMTQLPLPPVGTDGGSDEFMPQTENPLARPTMAQGFANERYGGMAGATGGMGLGMGASPVASLPGGARVSADIATNSLIVVAPANVQNMYAKLIESLDQRRPQVLIEAKIIAVDTSDEFSLGVEVSIGDRAGDKRLFKFTSFGLSEVNAETGALQIIPGLGFNGTLIDPDVADVVVRALSSHQRARVLAAPKLLVNDNSTGKLESVSSVPFASVNASETVATTSLGGSQQAGTIITVTPHINEENHLHLDFDVEFSTFAGTGVDGLPPPRQIDRVGSSVTIPDGKTVVVGGLKRVGDDDTFIGVPWAEKIPIVRELTSRTDRSSQSTSFFLFIRPVIMRDSQFADLRYFSDADLRENCLPGDYPTSQPELIP